MGSKARIAKHILPIILADRQPNQYYVEPFVGGANLIDKVDGNRIGSDNNKYLIALLRGIQRGWTPGRYVDKDTYNSVRSQQNKHSDLVVGWVAIGCSYNGKWFGGFAGRITTKDGTQRNYQSETVRNIQKQTPKLTGVMLFSTSYDTLDIPPISIIYCDPPYQSTTAYKDGFDHAAFWQWCRDKTKEGHTVFISEYSAPDDFECLWQKEIVSSLTQDTGSKTGIEKLFRLRR